MSTVAAVLPLDAPAATPATPTKPRTGGPRTERGRRIAAQNARKHGLCVSDYTLWQESPQELADLLAGLVAAHQPRDEHEQACVRAMATALHRQQRFARIEQALLAPAAPLPSELTRAEATTSITEAWLQHGRELDRLLRHRVAAERAYTRAYKDLVLHRGGKPLPQRSRQQRRRGPVVVEIVRDVEHAPANVRERGRMQNELLAHTQPQTEVGFTPPREIAKRTPVAVPCQAGQPLPPRPGLASQPLAPEPDSCKDARASQPTPAVPEIH